MKYEVITTNLCSKATTRHPNIQKTGDHIINIKCCGHLLFVTAIFEKKCTYKLVRIIILWHRRIEEKFSKIFAPPKKIRININLALDEQSNKFRHC